MSSYTMHYGDFIGLDASSDPRAVSRNRLAYAINMWRDYESEQGAAVETFPGFRRVAHSLGLDTDGGEIGAVHGLYHFRTRRGMDFVIVHAGKRIYAFEEEALASGDFVEIANRKAIISEGVADNDSTGFLFNNNLYILDGSHYLRVSDVGEDSVSIAASAVDAYIPTTYINGNMYEQRNMLTNLVKQVDTTGGLDEFVKYSDVYRISNGICYGFNEGYDLNIIHLVNNTEDGIDRFETFGRGRSVETLYAYDNVSVGTFILSDCPLKAAYFKGGAYIGSGAFYGCDMLTDVYTDVTENSGLFRYVKESANGAIQSFPDGVNIHYGAEINDYEWHDYKLIQVADGASDVVSVMVDDEEITDFIKKTKKIELDGEMVTVIDKVGIRENKLVTEGGVVRKVTLTLELLPTHFQTVANLSNFSDANKEYKKSTVDAINGCTKSAVYDGRVFLTGNGELPNTVFYSHRNLTGANDPAYFGIYNYFNDGVGNTPNVDLLATPSMLMVIKGDTVQDGSVYYHVGADNSDESTADLLPRIYPSTQGAAGLGSAGRSLPSRLSCNFLDDPVFLSKRGLEAVGKETVNLERTIQHRSSNIDRLLIKEDLSRASMTEWKGYLVICCDGHIYLADSRYMVQHADGSYQYEWYYLEGLGTYAGYAPRWGYWVDSYPLIESGNIPETLDNFLTLEGERVGDIYKLHESGDVKDNVIMTLPVRHPEDDSVIIDLYYAEIEGTRYVVGVKDEEKVGVGDFFGAKKILTVGDRLIFGTDNGDICIINTDKRGVSVGSHSIEPDRIDRSFYSFNGVAYLSGCSTRLDDCGKKSVTKSTEYGTTAVRFKMMPGSRARINVTLDGRNWRTLGEAYNSRFDFTDLQFSNFSFGENENNVCILPELTRSWVNKQYYIYNDRFEEPFGLYELSYVYYIYGKIRY